MIASCDSIWNKGLWKVYFVIALYCIICVKWSVANTFYPISEEQAWDETTLQEEILSDRIVDSRTHPGKKIRWVKIRYYSHEWKDGAWYGTITVALPENIPEREGMAAICPAGTINLQDGLDMKRDYMEFTALEFGIPVCSISQMGEHFGLTKIHQLSDHLNMQFLETEDPSWLAAYPCSAVRARAVNYPA